MIINDPAKAGEKILKARTKIGVDMTINNKSESQVKTAADAGKTDVIMEKQLDYFFFMIMFFV